LICDDDSINNTCELRCQSVCSGAQDDSVQLRAKIVSETPAGARESLRGFIETGLCKKTDYNVVHDHTACENSK
jgi:hypothetical protein